MAIRPLVGLIFVCTATSLLAAQHTTFRFFVGLDEVDTVEFDESRASADDVKHWMKFTENGYYSSAGISLSGCDEDAEARMLKDLANSGSGSAPRKAPMPVKEAPSSVKQVKLANAAPHNRMTSARGL
jgi:hypothetical protein